MPKSDGPRPLEFPDYRPAEKEADLWAGDTRQDIAVVEDFTRAVFLVMTDADAARYVKKHDAEVQYVAAGAVRDWEG